MHAHSVSHRLSQVSSSPNISGVAMMGDGFIVSSGRGEMHLTEVLSGAKTTRSNVAWDYHLIGG